MKKFLLLACAAYSLTAAAQGVTIRQVPVDTPTPRSVQATMDFCYCDAMGIAPDLVKAGTECSAAMYIPAETAARFKGATVKSVSVFAGYNPDTYTNTIPEATVWLSYDLDETPFTATTGKLSSDMVSYTDISLEDPYVIDGDKGFYIGYTLKAANDKQSPIIWDNVDHDEDYGSWVRMGADSQWVNLNDQYGAVLIKATFQGENLPLYNVGVFSSSSYGFAYPGDQIETIVNLINLGAASVDEVGLRINIGNDEPIDATMKIEGDIKYNDLFRIYLNAPVNTTGNNVPVRVTVTSVNGQPNTCEDATSTDYLLCLPKGEGFQRNVVMEQGTSLTVDTSPIGIVSNELLGHEYGTTSTFLPVMVHMYDELSGDGYEDFFTSYLCTKIPTVIPNRLLQYQNSSASYDSMDFIYNKVKEMPAYAKMSAKVTPDKSDPSMLDIHTSTTFLGDCHGEWRLAYVVRRDNVGPYTQLNGFAGGELGEMGNFADEPEYADIFHNNVGALIENYNGIEGTVPSDVKAGESYEYDYTLHLDDESKVKNTTILVYLINALNGVIENAVAIPYSEWITDGVETVDAETGVSAEVTAAEGTIRVAGTFAKADIHNVSGQRVATLMKSGSVAVEAGLYLVTVDGKTTKLLVK
ncbi:MAG: hypothetical protein K2M67_02730 [Muribaculaceae bacterium]|nr:hypothetical protein [Muribaculaceae bacterium]